MMKTLNEALNESDFGIFYKKLQYHLEQYAVRSALNRITNTKDVYELFKNVVVLFDRTDGDVAYFDVVYNNDIPYPSKYKKLHIAQIQYNDIDFILDYDIFKHEESQKNILHILSTMDDINSKKIKITKYLSDGYIYLESSDNTSKLDQKSDKVISVYLGKKQPRKYAGEIFMQNGTATYFIPNHK